MKKLLLTLLAVAMTLTLTVPAFAAAGNVEDEITQVTGTGLDNVSNSVTKEEKEAFKGQFKDKFDQLESLRAEAKSSWEQVKSLNQSIKDTWTKVKDHLKSMEKEQRKQTAEELKGKIQPLREQVKAIHTDIQTLREQKKTEWTNFREAVKARDAGKASTALDQILSLRKQINDKLIQLIDVKKQITSILNSYTA